MRRTGIILVGAALAFGLANADATACGQDGGRLKVGVYADEGASGIGAIEWFRLVHDSPEMELAVAAEKDFDLVPIDKDGIFQRRLDNIDVLVVSNDSAKKDETLAAAIQAFAVRGGKVIGFGAGCAVLPEGGIACEPCGGVVDTIKRIFGGKGTEGNCVR